MASDKVQAVQGKLETLDLGVAFPHPLDHLSVAECDIARQVVLDARGSEVSLYFRSIGLEEPPKNELIKYLETEHAQGVTAQTPRPARLAKVAYDIIKADRSREYTESLVDVQTAKETSRRVVDQVHQAGLIM